MAYKIMINHQIGTSTYETKEQAEQVAEYIKRTFKSLNVKIIRRLEKWVNQFMMGLLVF